MQSSSFILLTLIAINSAGDSPQKDYSYAPSGGEEGSCQFTGTISTGGNACQKTTITRTDFKQNGDLTWSILTKACPQLVTAGCADPTWGKDKSMDDLLWLNCGTCPLCPCNKDDDDTYYIHNGNQLSISAFSFAQCYACSCGGYNPKTVNGNITYEDYGRVCYNTHTAIGLDEINNLQCPYVTAAPTPAPTGGCDDGANNTYIPGQTFFFYDEDQCETYCICMDDNNPFCQTGWYDILNDDGLRYNFLETCADGLADAWDDSVRYVTPDTATCGPQYMYDSARCPTADCGGQGGTWQGMVWKEANYKTDGSYDYAIYDCVDCVCTGGEPICTTYDADERSEEECTRDELVCSFDENDNGVIDATGDDTICDVSAGLKYCGWRKSKVPDDFDSDTVCIEDRIEWPSFWGCFDDYLCDSWYGYSNLQGTVGRCSFDWVGFTAYSYDCLDYKWLSEDYELEVHSMCCTNEICTGHGCTCNDQAISSTALGSGNECGSNDKISKYLKVKYECMYGSRGIDNKDFIKHIQCGVDLPSDKYNVCELIGVYWQYHTLCECREYQVLQSSFPNDDYHNDLRADFQLKFDENNAYTKYLLEAWSEAYNCNEAFECDVTADNANQIKIAVSVVIGLVLNYLL